MFRGVASDFISILFLKGKIKVMAKHEVPEEKRNKHL